MEETKIKINIYFCDLENLKLIEDNSIFINLKKEIKGRDIIKENYGEIGDDNDCDIKTAKLIIAFAQMEDLHNKKTYNNLINNDNYIRLISDYKDKKEFNDKLCKKEKDITDNKKCYNPKSIIIIGLEDITEENNDIIQPLNLDQRVKFFDSNIWHRYVPLNEKFKDRFEEVIIEIVDNQKMKLYQNSIAREFLEFKTRMMVNSYLAPVGTHAHATHLIPYKFHSESLMKLLFDKEIKEVKEKFQKLRWKFLLIDDYDLYILKRYNDQNDVKEKYEPPEKCDSKGMPTKACIIKTILEDILNNDKEKKDKVKIVDWKENWDNDEYNNGQKKTIGDEVKNKSFLLCVKSIEEAKKALKAEMFDMIFLDYLFTEDGNLGSELLKDIQNDKNKDLRKNIGPLEKFWIFPISAFSYAMMDDLRESGLGYEDNYWHISSGSDPINTPWLFKYKLMKFLKQQTRTSEKDFSTFIKNNFKFKKDISESSKNCYSSLISLLKDHYSFINDRDKSFLAKSILIFIKSNNSHNHIWEHLRHLLYLLAFGSLTDWPEMWEEYTFIKNYLIEYENLSNLESYTRRIQDYIIKLQKEYR